MARRFRSYSVSESTPPEPTLWLPSHDPACAFWYEADSYRQDVVSGYQRWVPQCKLNNTANRELVHITAPTANSEVCKFDSYAGLPFFRLQGKGIKTVDTFQFTALDIYLLLKVTNAGGHTSRYADHDYGNGWWLGTGASAGTRGGGVRFGSNPYGAFATPFTSANVTGYFLMQLCRGASGGGFHVILNSDDQNRKATATGTAGITNANAIALGSDLGGNSGAPHLEVAAYIGYSSLPDLVGGRPGQLQLKRQGYLGHKFSVVKDAILLYDGEGTHPYWDSAPTVD